MAVTFVVGKKTFNLDKEPTDRERKLLQRYLRRIWRIHLKQDKVKGTLGDDPVQGFTPPQQDAFNKAHKLVIKAGRLSQVAKKEVAEEAIRRLELFIGRGNYGKCELDLTPYANELEYISGDLICAKSFYGNRSGYYTTVAIFFRAKLVFQATVKEIGPTSAKVYTWESGEWQKYLDQAWHDFWKPRESDVTQIATHFGSLGFLAFGREIQELRRSKCKTAL